jgi:hypothetical protein
MGSHYAKTARPAGHVLKQAGRGFLGMVVFTVFAGLCGCFLLAVVGQEVVPEATRGVHVALEGKPVLPAQPVIVGLNFLTSDLDLFVLV